MSDDATVRLELLKLARTIVNEEYINRRAEEHNKWVAMNDHSLRTAKVRTPYPAFTTYPSESVIIAKALAMYNFIAAPPAAAQAPLPVIEEPVAVAEIVEPAEVVAEEPPVPETEEELVVATVEDPAIAELLDRLAQEEAARARPMLVSVPVAALQPAEVASLDAGTNSAAEAESEESHLLPGWVKGWIRK